MNQATTYHTCQGAQNLALVAFESPQQGVVHLVVPLKKQTKETTAACATVTNDGGGVPLYS